MGWQNLQNSGTKHSKYHDSSSFSHQISINEWDEKDLFQLWWWSDQFFTRSSSISHWWAAMSATTFAMALTSWPTCASRAEPWWAVLLWTSLISHANWMLNLRLTHTHNHPLLLGLDLPFTVAGWHLPTFWAHCTQNFRVAPYCGSISTWGVSTLVHPWWASFTPQFTNTYTQMIQCRKAKNTNEIKYASMR